MHRIEACASPACPLRQGSGQKAAAMLGALVKGSDGKLYHARCIARTPQWA